jgi:acetyl esterase/lipase
MKRFATFALFLITLLCLGSAAYGIFWVRQYLSLTRDEPDVTLTPNISDLTYCTMDGEALKLDLYFPSNVKAPWQALVYTHGGSFTGGDKRTGSGTIDIPAMNVRGYAVAAVNYRLMPEHPFPAEIQDVKCAVRYLRAHASEYNLSTEGIGIWGGSAGGHLSAMMGLTNEEADYDKGEYLDFSSHVDAVVDMFGPADLTARMNWLQSWLLRRAFGTNDPHSSLLAAASPVNQTPESAPPFLIIQGDQDSAVPLEQSQALAQHLQALHVDTTLIVVKNANHNFKPTGGEISPTRAEISSLMADFFDRVLQEAKTK